MKLPNINKMHFVEALRVYNPLAFKDAKGVVQMYDKPEKMYLEMLERVYAQAPKGYFDTTIFMIENYGVDFKYALEFCKNFKLSGFLPRGGELPVGVQIVEWNGGWQQQLERFAVGLHNVTETKLQRDFYKSACEAFMFNHPILD